MGRHRQIENEGLPSHVYFKRDRWVYQPPSNEQSLKINGKLLRKDCQKDQIWKAYEELLSSSHTLNHLINEYLKSSQFKQKSLKTKREYQKNSETILNTKLKDSRMFGQISFVQITPAVVRKYLDSRDARINANREVAFLSSVYSWARERDFCSTNPCQGVRRNSEAARDRYVQDWEYQLVHKLAQQSSYPYIAVAMELSYLCRARQSEVFDLTLNDISDEGVFINRTKGSLPEVTIWTPRLRAAIQSAKAINVAVDSRYLLHDKVSRRFKQESIWTAWGRVIKMALGSEIEIDNKKYVLEERFTFHDLKAKGVSDHIDHESGHKSEKAKSIYMRKTKEVTATR